MKENWITFLRRKTKSNNSLNYSNVDTLAY
jgi:hypothetical protein